MPTLVPFTWKNLRSAIYKHWQELRSENRSIFLIPLVLLLRSLTQYHALLRKMTVLICTLTLGQMIPRYFSTPYDFLFLVVSVASCFWITSLWLFLGLQGRMNALLSIISQPASKSSSKNSTSP